MRFNRYPKFEFVDSNQKRAAIKRRHKKEKQRYPLLDLIGEIEPPDIDKIMIERKIKHFLDDAADRIRRANDWKRARALLRQHPEKRAIYFYWQTYSLTASPVYLLSLVKEWETRKNDRLEAEKRMNGFRESRGEAPIPENKSLTIFYKKNMVLMQ